MKRKGSRRSVGFLLAITFCLLSLILAVESGANTPISVEDAVNVDTAAFDVAHGDVVRIAADNNSHTLCVQGYGHIAFTVVFEQISSTGKYRGAINVVPGGHVMSLDVRVVVIGKNCRLTLQGDVPGIRFPASMDVTVSFYMQENSRLLVNSTGNAVAVVANENNGTENITCNVYNMTDAQSHTEMAEVIEYITTPGTDFTLSYMDNGDPALPMVPPVHEHTYGQWIPEVAADCETAGTLGHYHCAECGMDFDEDYVQLTDLTIAAEHTFGQWIAENPATCEQAGTLGHYHCEVCGKNFDAEHRELTDLTIAAEHTFGEWIAELPATCEQAGTLGHYHCEVCGKDFDEKLEELPTLTLEPTDHTFGEWIAENPATCEQAGTLGHYHCEVCGKNFDEKLEELPTLTLEPTGHAFGEWIAENPATCEHAGVLGHYHCDACGKNFNANYVELSTLTIEPMGHDLVHHDAKPATYQDIGWDAYDTCTRCNYTTYVEQPRLEPHGDYEEEEEKQIAKQIAAENLIAVIGDESSVGAEELQHAIDAIDADTVIQIAEKISNAYDEINGLFENAAPDEKLEVQPGVELTQQEALAVISAVTESVIAIAADKENAVAGSAEIEERLPADAGIDLGSTVDAFYARVTAELLGQGTDPANGANGQVDFSVDPETYRQAVDFVETSVGNITEAALKVRNCSGEAVKANINHYISGISVQSFRDFDREKADAEFAEMAYQAILLSLQETVKNALTESYEKEKQGKSGRALSDLTEQYETEMAQVSRLHFVDGVAAEECEGCFEDIVIEVMRLKYLSILNAKLNAGEITAALFTEYAANAADAETFAPTYREIFFRWATGAEDTSEVQISLQELSDAAIENTSAKISPTAGSKTATLRPADVRILVISGVTLLALLIVLFTVSKVRRKEAV